METSEDGWRQPINAEWTGSVKGSKVVCLGKFGGGGNMEPMVELLAPPASRGLVV